MVEVTEADRIAAAAYMKLVGSQRWSQEGILSGGCDNTSIVQAFATHRETAAKAERDRLLTPASLEKIARSIGRETVARDDRGILFDDLPEEDKATVLEMLAAALADALESKP